MNQLTHLALSEERYLGCPTTTLGPAELAEIGRVITHHGLLVYEVQEFVSYVASQTQRLPASIGFKQSMRLLPSVMEMIKPAFSLDRRKLLKRALDQVAIARVTMDRFHYSCWGASSEGKRFTRTEHRRYKGGGCWSDQSVYTTQDLHVLAMEISLATSYLGDVRRVLQRKIDEEPDVLKKKIDRKRLDGR